MKNRLYKEVPPSRLLSRDVSEIRIAVAGLGKMGAYHVRAIQQLSTGVSEDYYKSGLGAQISKLKLCGLCDLSREKARGIAEGVPFFEDWQDLLMNCRPDLVVIASPTKTHFNLALKSLQTGVHTFVEKPLVTSINEFTQLMDVAAANGCRLISGHVERYNPVAIKLRAMLTAGLIDAGDYHFQRSQPHDARISDDIVTDKIIHDLDLALYFFGAITGVQLLDAKRIDGQIQEASVRLQHANGTKGTLFVSWLLSDEKFCREVHITCKDSTTVVGDFSGKALRVNGQSVSCEVPFWVRPDNNQIKDELADFVAFCIIPDPVLPVFQPLLQPGEIETSVVIIEKLLRETEEPAGEKF